MRPTQLTVPAAPEGAPAATYNLTSDGTPRVAVLKDLPDDTRIGLHAVMSLQFRRTDATCLAAAFPAGGIPLVDGVFVLGLAAPFDWFPRISEPSSFKATGDVILAWECSGDEAVLVEVGGGANETALIGTPAETSWATYHAMEKGGLDAGPETFHADVAVPETAASVYAAAAIRNNDPAFAGVQTRGEFEIVPAGAEPQRRDDVFPTFGYAFPNGWTQSGWSAPPEAVEPGASVWFHVERTTAGVKSSAGTLVLVALPGVAAFST